MRSNLKGLTLIEVLIIVVMIGILLTIGFQKIRGPGAKDVVVSLTADVENARDAETKYFGAHNAYGSLAQLDSAKLVSTSAGNTITIAATATGYTATARNDADPAKPRTCTIEVTGGETGAGKAKTVCN